MRRADVAGRFDCSSSLLNSIYAMCERSARQNVQQGIISVDANREQSAWLADSWNVGNVLLYNHRNTTIVDKVLRDYAGEQLPGADNDLSSNHAVCRFVYRLSAPSQIETLEPNRTFICPMA